MRQTVISTILFLLCTLMICTFSLLSVENTSLKAERICSKASAAAKGGNSISALESIAELETFLDERGKILEMLIAHDDLHEISSCITDARVYLEIGDIDNYLLSAEHLKTAIRHIRSIQRISLGNLY